MGVFDMKVAKDRAIKYADQLIIVSTTTTSWSSVRERMIHINSCRFEGRVLRLLFKTDYSPFRQVRQRNWDVGDELDCTWPSSKKSKKTGTPKSSQHKLDTWFFNDRVKLCWSALGDIRHSRRWQNELVIKRGNVGVRLSFVCGLLNRMVVWCPRGTDLVNYWLTKNGCRWHRVSILDSVTGLAHFNLIISKQPR